MKPLHLVITGLMLVLMLSGCETNPVRSDLVSHGNATGDRLAAMAWDINLDSRPVTIVTTFVEGEDFNRSSAFGRTVSDLVAGRLAQLGFPVREIRLRNGIMMKGNLGELILSRETQQIAREHGAEAVVVGTYSESVSQVYVSAKMIRLSDDRVVSAHQYAIAKDENIAGLLHGLKKTDGAQHAPSPDSGGVRQRSLMDAIRAYDEGTYGRRP